jgi:hypothetical protein
MKLTWAAAVFAALLAITVAFAQQPQPQQVIPDENAVFKAETNLIVLHASVVDKNGKLLTNVPRTAFHVFENNAEQVIKDFRREDVPVSLGIIIDNSGSMRDKRQRVAAASLALVKASNPLDEVFIVNFNDDAFWINPSPTTLRSWKRLWTSSTPRAAPRCATRLACRSIMPSPTASAIRKCCW